MDTFDGFPPGKERLTRIPLTFFKELLPKINDLGELKVTLYAFWMLDRMEGDIRYFQFKDLLEDETFCAGMGKTQKESKKNIQFGLDLAIKRGTFLATEINLPNSKQILYFLNTLRGQTAIKAINIGNWEFSGDTKSPIKLKLDTPNIFRLYEDNIGPLTPMIADALKDAEKEYSSTMVSRAIKIAAFENKRNLRYIQVVLRNIKEKDGKELKKESEKDFRRYGRGKYGEIIKNRDNE